MCKRLTCLVALVALVGLFGGSVAFGYAPLNDPALLGWWAFEEGSGDTCADSSPNGRDGTAVEGDLIWEAGVNGSAIRLQGGLVEIPAINMNLTDATMAGWINPNGSQPEWSAILMTRGSATGLNLLASNQIAYHWGDAPATYNYREAPYVEPGEWSFVTVTITPDQAVFYLNGEESSTNDTSHGSVNWNADIYIGGDGSGSYNDRRVSDAAFDDVSLFSRPLTGEEIVQIMQGLVKPGLAGNPSPLDGAIDVLRTTSLSWGAGEFAATHNVYLGTNPEDVNDASVADPRGVLISEGQSGTTYDPPSRLAFGQTYYWRVDEVNAPSAGSTVYEGDMWSFTTEPYAYLVVDVNATASIPAKVGAELENIINGSGLTEEGGHSAKGKEMWQGEGEGDIPVSIEFTLDRVYKLDEMRIWNYNHDYEFILGFGLKDVTVEYSTDANEWTVLGDYVLPQGTGLVTFPAEVIDFGGTPAKYVRLIKNSHYGGKGFGLSEVQFYYLPTFARDPDPEAGTVDVGPDVTLNWRPGREAVSHEVHVGTDSNAVALAGTVSVPSYDTAGLNLLLSEKYYWMVNEVNEAEATPSWSSAVWDFNTPDFIAVDDFESYTDDLGSRVYETWLDGYDDSSNGSIVGNDDPPYADQDNIHSGAQSMPFTFGVEGATTSEAELSLDGTKDWTRADAQTLAVWFRGSLGNGTPQLYLKVNDTRVDYDGSAGSLAGQVWKQWNVDLASLGAAASNARTLVLGVSGAGAGMMYFDDIRLYRTAPPATGDAVDPGTANLAAYYPMSDNANDASGHSLDGTVEVGSSFETGPIGYGRAVAFDGTSGYVDLPIGSLIQSLNSITVATWVRRDDTGSWQRVFDFGTDTTVYMFLSPTGGSGVRFAITTGGGGEDNESQLTSASALPANGTWHHVAATIDGASGEMKLYVDGSLADSGTTALRPCDLGETTQNWIGRSQYDADPYLTGAVDEFRIYNRALSAEEIQYLAGDR